MPSYKLLLPDDYPNGSLNKHCFASVEEAMSHIPEDLVELMIEPATHVEVQITYIPEDKNFRKDFTHYMEEKVIKILYGQLSGMIELKILLLVWWMPARSWPQRSKLLAGSIS